jgi:hypothetical protein
MIADEPAFAAELGPFLTERVELIARAMCRHRDPCEREEPCGCEGPGAGSCIAFGLYGGQALAAYRAHVESLTGPAASDEWCRRWWPDEEPAEIRRQLATLLACTAASAPKAGADAVAAYNARFDPADEAGAEIYRAAHRDGWMDARFPDGTAGAEAEEVEEEYRRYVDGVLLGEGWAGIRDRFFARLPLAALGDMPTAEGDRA